MEILLAFGIPLLFGVGVFAMFRRDLENFRTAEKLKVGELEALVKRHRRAIMIHFGALLIILPLMIFFLQSFALLGAILLAGVFLAHVSALARFSRPIIAALQFRNDYYSRLQADIHDEAPKQQEDGDIVSSQTRFE